MFRCCECGSEYEIKPDFCDCGNDTFDEIITAKSDEKVIPSIKINKSEILSWFIFIICIISSVFVLLFFPKIEEKQHNKPQVVDKPAVSKDIPNLNSFWIDCKPEPEVAEPAESIKEVLNVFKPEKKVQKQEKKPQTQIKQTTQKKETDKQKTTPKPAAQKPVVQQTKQTPKQQVSQNNIEFLNYRNGLRNKFKSNLPFGEIDGEGKCCVEFSIDSTGKLINRGFTYQSENKSVNDAVYKMLMRTPYYETPPASYNGKKIKLLLKLSPTYYEMTFVQ